MQKAYVAELTSPMLSNKNGLAADRPELQSRELRHTEVRSVAAIGQRFIVVRFTRFAD